MDSRTQITLIEQTSLEVADVRRAENEFEDEFEAALEDGVITPEEAEKLYRRIRKLEREIDEAVLVSREAAYVEKENDFRRKRGMNATPHYYLLREKREIQEMGGLKDYPPKRQRTSTIAVVKAHNAQR